MLNLRENGIVPSESFEEANPSSNISELSSVFQPLREVIYSLEGVCELYWLYSFLWYESPNSVSGGFETLIIKQAGYTVCPKHDCSMAIPFQPTQNEVAFPLK